MVLVKVAADKQHLVNPKGQPFFGLGVNYIGYFDRAWKMWAADEYEPELIARDFRKIQHGGFNMVRLFIDVSLSQALAKGDFVRLDETLSLAQDHNLLVLLSLNWSHSLDLQRVAELDAKIGARYGEVPTVAGYDLQKEPVYYDLAAARYPEGVRPPLQTSELVDHYGPRVERSQVADWRRHNTVPTHLDEEAAFYYINGLQLFLEYDAAARAFIKQTGGTLLDFMFSDQAAAWHTLVGVLDGTVETWLKARIEPIRAVGCRHLLTVGWSWPHLAFLPGNRLLDVQAYNAYGSLSFQGFQANLAHLDSLRRAFPRHPIMLSEFGWSNRSGTGQPVNPQLTALYEAATYAYLRTHGFGGGFKWTLNDIEGAEGNPPEANFGIFSPEDQAKPIREIVRRFGEEWPAVSEAGSITLLRDSESGLTYRLDMPGRINLGGHVYQDETLSWQAEGEAGHCFIRLAEQELLIETEGAGRLSLDPWELVPGWNRARETDLYRVYSDQQRTRQQSFAAGQGVVVEARPGARYALTMGAQAPWQPLPEDAPRVEPKAGEHVLVLADADRYLPAALKYIRRFAPDFTFAPEEVAGRWAYVSVAAPAEVVPDERLDEIRGAGALLVERVAAETVEATGAMLDELARRGQRFLTATAPLPPQEEPPAEPSPPAGQGETSYTVQPGDTLSKIAQQVYGDFRQWPRIFEANRDKLAEPGLIRVGLELRIPTGNPT